MSDAAVESLPHARSTVPSVRRTEPHGAVGGLALASQRYVLILRFALVNCVGATALVVAWSEGLVTSLLAADASHLCLLIFAVFVAGTAICAQKIWRCGRELNLAKEFDPEIPSRAQRYVADTRGRDSGARAILASSLKFKLVHRIAVVRQISSTLVLLGLIGTVIGFIMALGGVDPQKATDVNAVGPMVARLVEGLSVKLYATLVGGVLNIWLNVNYHMLASATVNLVSEIVALGERHAGP